MLCPAGSGCLFREGLPTEFVVNQCAHFLIKIFVCLGNIVQVSIAVIQVSDAASIIVCTDHAEVFAATLTVGNYAEIISLICKGVVQYIIVITTLKHWSIQEFITLGDAFLCAQVFLRRVLDGHSDSL